MLTVGVYNAFIFSVCIVFRGCFKKMAIRNVSRRLKITEDLCFKFSTNKFDCSYWFEEFIESQLEKLWHKHVSDNRPPTRLETDNNDED